jgi:PAS domain S-box-containing protein
MKKLYKIAIYISTFTVLIGGFIFSKSASAQTIYPKLKSAFILQFTNNVTWANESQFETFRIGVLGNDPETFQALKEISQKTKIRNKTVEIVALGNFSKIPDIQLLYVSNSEVEEIKEIYAAIEKRNILLVSENCTEAQYVMLNIVYNTTSESVSFEINKANLVIENFNINSELLLLGGTEIDVRDIYRDMRQSLASEKKKADEQKTIIEDQTNKIIEQNAITDGLLKNTKQLETIIQKKETELQKIVEETTKQNNILVLKTEQIARQELEFKELEKKFEEWEKRIKQKSEELEKLTAEINERNETIQTQKNTISNQKSVLNSKEQFIDTQKRLLLLSIAFAIVLLLLGASLFRAYKVKKQTNKLLEEKVAARTIELQESEVRFRSTFEQAAVGIVHMKEINQPFIRINKRFTELLGGYTPQEVQKLKYSDVVHPDFKKRDLDLFRSISLNQIQDFTVETKLIQKDGSIRWVNLTLSSVVSAENKTSYLVGVISDISERKKVEEELILARSKAEESDRLKSAFLANMSHEIRTPMNGILGFATLLKEPQLSGDKQQQYIGIIEKSGARLLNIINDLIDISKVESGQMELYISETNITQQVEYIQDFFKPEIQAKNMQLLVEKGKKDEDIIIYTDKEKVYAILINLVKNAIKYSDNGTIEIGYKKTKKEISFYIKDTGIGIPKDRMEAIFERFVQADVLDKKALQGAGLGLSITKYYVEMLGGKIWVESEPNKGSTFYFTIADLNEKSKKSSRKVG